MLCPPLARPEGVTHAYGVVPLSVTEILRRERGDRTHCPAVGVAAGQERLVELPQLLASLPLQDEVAG